MAAVEEAATPQTSSRGPNCAGGHPRRLEIGWLSIIALACLATRVVNIDRYTGSYPEGIRAEQLFLMAAGFRPFQDIFSDQGPWLLQVLYPGYLLFGGSLVGVRSMVVVASLVGLIGLYWLLRRTTGPVAALAGIVMLGLSPIYLQFSRLAVAEVLALAPAILALGCALRFGQHHAARWLYLASACLAISLLIKPITIGSVVPVGLAVWLAGGRRWQNLLRVCLVTGMLGLVGLLLVGLPEVVQQIVQFRLASRVAEGWSLATNLARFRSELRAEGVALPALAAAGALFAVSRRAAWPLLAWALSAGATVLAHAPLHSKHFAIVVVPLVALAAYGLARLASFAADLARPRWKLLASIGLASALGLYCLALPPVLARDWRVLTSDDLFERDAARIWYADAIETIRRVVGPDEFLVTDHAYLAYAAQRLVPPEMVEASATRVKAGSLTDAMAIEVTERYQVRAVLLWADKLSGLRRYQRWLTEHYVPVRIWAAQNDTRPVLWLRSDERIDADKQALRQNLNRSAATLSGWRLLGYGLDRAAARPGDAISTILEFEPTVETDARAEVLLSLVDSRRQFIDQEQERLYDIGIGHQHILWVGAVHLPQAAEPGNYDVMAAVVPAPRRAVGQVIRVGTVAVGP